MFEIFALRAFSDNYIWTLIKEDEVTVIDPGDSNVVLDFLDKKQLYFQRRRQKIFLSVKRTYIR